MQPRAIDFEQLDVDDDLGPRLVDRAEHACDGCNPLRRVLDGERVRAGNRCDLPGVDDDSEKVDRLLEVGVAEIEGPHHLFLVLRRFAGVSGTIVIVRGAVTR